MKLTKKSKVSASSAFRWLECTASVEFIENNPTPQEPPTEAAIRGNDLHELGSDMLKMVRNQQKPVMWANNYPEADQQMVKRYVQYCMNLVPVEDVGKFVGVEMEVPLWYMKDKINYIDFCGFDRKDPNLFHFVDFKSGQPVEVEDNPQLLIYMICIYEILGPIFFNEDMKIMIHIYQENYRGPVSRVYTIKELLKKKAYIGGTILYIEQDQVEFKPSKSVCKWCPAFDICVERQKADTNVLPESLGLKMTYDAETITLEQAIKIHEKAKEIEKTLEVAKKMVSTATEEGQNTGFKLVPGNKSRSWDNADEVKSILIKSFKKPEFIQEKMVSPSGFEDLCTKKKLRKATIEAVEAHVVTKRGKDKLVPLLVGELPHNQVTDVSGLIEKH